MKIITSQEHNHICRSVAEASEWSVYVAEITLMMGALLTVEEFMCLFIC